MLVAIIYVTKLIKTKLIFKLELREVSYKQITYWNMDEVNNSGNNKVERTILSKNLCKLLYWVTVSKSAGFSVKTQIHYLRNQLQTSDTVLQQSLGRSQERKRMEIIQLHFFLHSWDRFDDG